MSQLDKFQEELIKAAIAAKALRFGNFTLKSGRSSPYFFNAGLLCSGPNIAILAAAYANIISSFFKGQFDVLFGPAYKGIPLVGATSLLLHQDHGINVGYAYDRKEAKDHGEGGNMVGTPVKGKRVLILDDVMTAGTAIRSSLNLIQKEEGIVIGFVLALDREEVSVAGENTVQEVQKLIGKPGSLKSILKMRDLMAYVEMEGTSEEVESLKAYYQQYGIKS